MPPAGSDLVFDAAGANRAMNNNIAAGRSFNSLDFTAGGYSVTGNSIVLVAASLSTSCGVVNICDSVASGGNAIGITIGGGATRTITVANAAETLTLSGIISGAGAVTKDGPGILVLSGGGANTYNGATTVNAGELDLNKTAGLNALAGPLTIGDGTGTDTVKLLAADQIPAVTVTVSSSGVLDLNGNAEALSLLIIESGTASGGSVTTGAGTLTLAGNVTMNVAGTGAAGATIAGNLALSATRTFTVADGAATDDLTISALISGGGGLTKAGAGQLTLANAGNSYTGVTTISAGALSVSALANGGSNSNLGASSNVAANLVINGGTLQYIGPAVSTDRLFSVGSTAGSTIDSSGSGALTFTNTGAIGVPAAAVRTLTLTGSGAGSLACLVVNQGASATSLVKAGASTWTLASANTYTGATTVSAGTLLLGVAGAIGGSSAVTVVSGATLDLNGFGDTIGSLSDGGGAGGTVTSGTPGAVTLVAGGNNSSTTFSGVIQDGSGTVTLTKAGTGVWTLSGNNSYSGLTTISAGTIKLGAAGDGTNSPLGTIAGAASVTSGAALDLNGFTLSTAESLTLNGTGIGSTGTLINSSGSAVTYSGVITLGSASSVGGTGNVMLSGAVGGGFALTKVGVNTLTLSGNNTYTGATTISAGMLQLGASGTAPNGPLGTIAGSTSVTSGAALDLNGFTLATAESLTLNGTGVGASGSLVNSGAAAGWSGTVALATGSSVGGSGDVTLSGVISGAGGLTKVGANALTLPNATSSYTGVTTINAGTLVVGANAPNNANGALGHAVTAVLVGGSADASLLTNGALAVGRPMTVQAGGGTATLGGSNASGTATFSGAITLNKDVTLTAATGGAVTFSGVLSGAGGVTVDGGGTVALSSANTINGNLTISAGTFVAPAGTLTLKGNYTNNGAFTHGSGTVLFGGTAQQTLSGAMTGASAFHNLTITNTSGADDPGCGGSPPFTPGIVFAAAADVTQDYTISTGSVRVRYLSGATYTFNNVTWNGQSTSTRIFFRPSGASPWNLTITGTQVILYLNIGGANASGQIGMLYGIDCGNNTNWLFTPDPTSVTPQFLGQGATGKTLTVNSPLVSFATGATVTFSNPSLDLLTTGGFIFASPTSIGIIGNVIQLKPLPSSPPYSCGSPLYSCAPQTATSASFGSGYAIQSWDKLRVGIPTAGSFDGITTVKVAYSTDGGVSFVNEAGGAPFTDGGTVITADNQTISLCNTVNTCIHASDPTKNRIKVQVVMVSTDGTARSYDITALQLYWVSPLAGNGISITSGFTVTGTTIDFNVDIDPLAPAPASFDVTVTNPDSTVGTCYGCFLIVQRPVTLNLSPSSWTAGPSPVPVNPPNGVTLTGAYYNPGATVSFGADITVGSCTIDSATQIRCPVTIDAAAPDGFRPVVVTNPDGGTSEPAYFYVGPIAPPGAMTVYGAVGVDDPRFRLLLPDGNWSPESGVGSFSGAPRWSVLRASPVSTEKVLGVLNTSGGLTLLTWSGSSWNTAGAVTATSVIGSAAAVSRGFDLAYEQTSGDALAVYAPGSTASVVYRVWDHVALSWSGETTVTTANAASWVRLVPRPGSEQILLVYEDSAGALRARLWNGTGFDPGEQLLAQNITAEQNLEPFDAAYEQTTCINNPPPAMCPAIVVWTAENEAAPVFRLFNGATWAAPQAVPIGMTANPGDLRAIRLAADLSSDRMAVGVASISGQLSVSHWNGTQWETGGTGAPMVVGAVPSGVVLSPPSIISQGSPFDLAWLGPSGTTSRLAVSYGGVAPVSRNWTAAAGWSSTAANLLPGTILKGQWHLDETTITLVDSSGNGDNLTLTGSAAAGQPGISNRAVVFVSGSATTVDDPPPLSLTGTELTMSAWVYPTSASGNRMIVNKDQSYEMAVNNGVFQVAVNTTSGSCPGSWSFVGTTALALNTWQHVAATYDGSQINLYVNGQLQNPQYSKTGSICPSTAPLLVGAGPAGTHFQGLIDEVQILSAVRPPLAVMRLETSPASQDILAGSLSQQPELTTGFGVGLSWQTASQVASNPPGPSGAQTASSTTYYPESFALSIARDQKLTVLSATPGAGSQGEINLPVTITGTNFANDATVTFDCGGCPNDGITPSVVGRTATTIDVTITIDPGATSGPRNIQVTNPTSGESAIGFSLFTVGLAVLSTDCGGVTNCALGQGANQDVTVNGLGFNASSQVTVNCTIGGCSNGVVVNSTLLISPTQLQVSLTIDEAATVGLRDVQVTNAGPIVGTGAGLFSVVIGPKLDIVSPNALLAGDNIDVMFIGQYFQDGATVDFGDPLITVGPCTFGDSTRITCNIAVDSFAGAGFRTVTVINPAPAAGNSGRGSKTNGFEVRTTPPPPVNCGGGDLVVSSGTTTLSSNTVCNNVTVNGGATLQINNGITLTVNNLLAVGGATAGTIRIGTASSGSAAVINVQDLTVSTNGTIQANGTGCPKSQSAQDGGSCLDEMFGVDGSGQTIIASSREGGNTRTAAGGGGGGGYGGAGGYGGSDQGTSSGEGGHVYGTAALNELMVGSGGGDGTQCGVGGAGGGAIWLDVSGTLTVDGTISAEGAKGLHPSSCGSSDNGNSAGGGGGSGGSIRITVNNLAGGGSGMIQANGGNGSVGGDVRPGATGGGGGGGRIRIELFGTDNYLGALQVTGGSRGPGSPNTSSGHLGQNGASGTLVYSGNVAKTLCDGTFAGGIYAGLTIDPGCVVTFTGDVTVNGTLDVNGTMILTADVTVAVNGLMTVNDTVILGSTAGDGMGSHIVATDLVVDGTIQSNGMGCPTSQSFDLSTGSGCVDVAIPATLGFGEGGDTTTAAGGGGGAGYGGAGGNGGFDQGTSSGDGGNVYGSQDLAVIMMGSGGGYGTQAGVGGAGGGAIWLDVSGTLTVNGTILANGANGHAGGGNGNSAGGGGGSGGSIRITVSTLAGGGTINANGGSGGAGGSTRPGAKGGRGGGGRVMISYNVGNPGLLTIAASRGSTGAGGADGTVMLVHPDTIPPDPIVPLEIDPTSTYAVSSVWVDLRWQATGDDGMTGTAAHYDLRYLENAPIVSDDDYQTASLVIGEPAPAVAGTVQYMRVAGLQPDTTYCFAIKGVDAAINASALDLTSPDTLGPGPGYAPDPDNPNSTVCAHTEVPDTTPPAPITDLAAASVKIGATSIDYTDRVQLTWTATGDDDPAIVGGTGCTPNPTRTVCSATSYELRYAPRSSPATPVIIDDASFDAAIPVSGAPTPQAIGSAETFVVTGLQSGVTYDFAIKACDEVPDCSLLNTGTLPLPVNFPLPLDTTPPADVTDLATGAVTTTSVTLAFSAPGDDGTPSPASLPTAGPCPCGRSTSYVVKYSTTDTITDQSSFDGAANFVNAIVPQDALQPESITVTGLSPNTQYWFAVEAVDEKGNHSGCCDPPLSGKSKVVSATTLQASDVIPPGPITDLQEIAVTDQTVTLQWTARGDDGNVGTATAYNVRYAHTPITSINEFNKATQAVTNPPAPLASGLTETRTVTLAPYQFMTSDTVYYFAIVAIDDGNNTSPLGTLTNSNVDAACAIDCRVRTLLRPQYNLVSAPRQGPLSPTDLFGPLDLLTDPCGSGDLPCLYKWVSTGLTNIDGDYQLMNPDPCDPFCVMEGDGYFFYTADVSLLTTALGGPVPTHPDSDGHYTGSNPSGLHAHILLDRDGAGPELSAGWHLIGNLFDKDVLLKDVNVRLVDDGGSCTGAVKTFDEAVTAGWVGNSIYVSTTNDGAGSTPVPYDDGNPLTQDATLQPWQSYWIQVLQNDCTYELVMPKPN